MIKPTTLSSIAILSILLSLTQAQDFSQFEIVNAEKIVQLNGAYPIESNKVEYRCITSCKGFVYHALPLE